MARKGVGADVRGWAWVRAFDKDDTGYTHSWDAWRLPDRTLEEEGGWEESVGASEWGLKRKRRSDGDQGGTSLGGVFPIERRASVFGDCSNKSVDRVM